MKNGHRLNQEESSEPVKSGMLACRGELDKADLRGRRTVVTGMAFTTPNQRSTAQGEREGNVPEQI